ncbi:MAG TPA: hypothetical protein ENK80_04005 [Rhodobacterales bacterium]|nr:hypothetical protein [Rhodobacterales bacterium]
MKLSQASADSGPAGHDPAGMAVLEQSRENVIIRVLRGFFFVVPMAVGQTVLAGDLASETWDACASAPANNEVLHEGLAELGWLPVAIGDTNRFVGLLADGVMATMSGGPEIRRDWSRVARESSQFVALLLSTQTRVPDMRFFMTPKAPFSVLAVLPREELGPGVFHCVFSGQLGDETREYLRTLAALYEQRGVAQANPEINVFLVEGLEFSTDRSNTNVLVDAVLGQFVNTQGIPPYLYNGSEYAYLLTRYEKGPMLH